MTPHQVKRTKIFISYSHEDSVWLERLRVHLKPLERDFGAEVWEDTRIQSGARWREEIERALESAAVAILLVSADFLASDFIATNELPPLLKAAEDEGTVILPIIINHSGFTRHAALSQFQAFNSPSKPLLDLSKGKQAAILEKVAERVAALLVTPANVNQRNAPPRSAKAEQPSDERQVEEPEVSVAWSRQSSDERSDPSQIPEDRFSQRQAQEHRINYWPVVAVIGLVVLAVSIVLAARQFGNRAEGMTSGKKPELSRSITPPPQPGSNQAQPALVNVTIEKGGTARIFDESVNIQLEGIRFDAGSNQYLASFRLSSPNFREIRFRDAPASGEKVYTYPADGKFKIHLLSAAEGLAGFSIEEAVN